MTALLNTNDTADEVFGEHQAFADILVWSESRPVWQRDALRRLSQGSLLSDDDLDELLKLCLDPSLPNLPLSAGDVSAQAGTSEAISLLRIEEPKGVNALAADQTLVLAPSGLTVIYGDNASGKSGYVRVLKHACRTRDRGVKILRDVESVSTQQQSANIVFSRGGIEDAFEWTPEAAAHSDLPSISIFDSRSANIHVEKTNAVAYIPLPMKILEALAVACDRLKEKLDFKLSELSAQTPLGIKDTKLGTDTAAGAFVRGLSSKSNVAQLDLLAELSDLDVQRLATLEADLAQDPQRAAARINNQKIRFDGLADGLKKLCDTSSVEAFRFRDALKSDWDTKAEAAKLAADALFAASPLPQVGEAIWRGLWEAARRYSDTVAYPERIFPDPHGQDELCVLCQQPLDEKAVERRITFESFLKGTTKSDEEAAEKSYRQKLADASKTRVSVSVIRQFVAFIDSEIGDPALASRVRETGILAAWRLRAFEKGRHSPTKEAMFPSSEISEASLNLADRVSKLSAAKDSPEHLGLVKECRELKDRGALKNLSADIVAEIDRLKEAEKINLALKDTAKRGVTAKNKDLSDKIVTNALRGRFIREIEKLKLARMPVELKKIKDQNAVSYFQVVLVEKPDEPVGDIFSEGEHRCVALAAFLAELVTSRQYSSIVFDDPMSSLDHIHRKAVAARLVEESTHRQVVVFTHDLTFLFELRREADAKVLPIAYQTVSRRQNKPGFIEAELPMKAKSAQQLAIALRSELKVAKPHFDSWPDARRTLFCKGVIEQLRESWDQGIADFVFPVLGRFDNAIKGSSLYKLAVLTDEDVKTVTAARGRLSEDLHTSAETLNPETISHADLLAEVVKLETWLTSIIDRQKSAKVPITSYA